MYEPVTIVDFNKKNTQKTNKKSQIFIGKKKFGNLVYITMSSIIMQKMGKKYFPEQN
jgi:hypothetical protein